MTSHGNRKGLQSAHFVSEVLEARQLLTLVGTPGDLYVSGQQADLIYEVNPTSGAIVGSASSDNGDALGIRFDSAGNLNVVDYSAGSIEKYNGATGAHLGTLVTGIADPYNLAYANNQIYAASSDNQQVLVFNSSGGKTNTITSSDFSNYPLGIAISPTNRVVVGTRSGTQIDGFNLDGTSPSVFASGNGIGPTFGLAFSPNGNLYASNINTNKILEFNGTTGAYITSITGGGLNGPMGLTFSPAGNLYVANNGNDTVSEFNSSGGAVAVFTGFSGVYDLTFNTSATASKLAFTTAPTNTTAGASIDSSTGIQVSVENSAGTAVTGNTNSITLSLGSNPGGATLGGTLTATAVNGVATFTNISITSAASGYTLVATDTTTASVTANTSSGFNITATAAAKLAFANSPSNTIAGASINSPTGVQVKVEDTYGNLVSSSDTIYVGLSSNPTSTTLMGTTAVAASSGTATFTNIALTTTATGYSLFAYDETTSGLYEGYSTPFNITPAAAAKLGFSNQPAATQPGSSIDSPTGVQVALEDAYGNVVTGSDTIKIAIGTNPGNATLVGTLSAAAVNGVATFTNLTIATLATGYTLTATDSTNSNISTGTSGVFTIGSPAAGDILIADNNIIRWYNGSTGTYQGIFAQGGGLGYSDGFTYGPDGNLYVSDFLNDRILKFYGQTGTYISVFATGSNYLSFPTFGPDGNLYATNDYGTIEKFNGSTGADMGVFITPPSGDLVGGMTFHGGFLFVASQDGNFYQYDASTGVLVADLYSGLVGPQAPLFGANGMIYIPDWQTNHIVELNGTSYAFVQNITTNGNKFPVDLGNSADGSLLVLYDTEASSDASSIDRYSFSTNSYLSTLIAPGNGSTDRMDYFNVVPASNQPAKLAFTAAPTSSTAGASIDSSSGVQVSVENSAGTVVTGNGDSVTLSLGSNPGGATLGGTLTATAVNGVATFSNLTITKAASGYTLVATDNTPGGVTSITSGAFNITAAAVSKLAYNSTAFSTVAGSPIGNGPGVTVAVEDAYGNLTSSTNTIAVSVVNGPVGATLGGTLSATAAAGIATFSNLTLTVAASGYSLNATDSTTGTVSSIASPAFTVSPAIAAKLVFSSQPTSTASGAIIDSPNGVQLSVEDIYGNLTSSTDTIAIALANNPGGGTLSGMLTAAAVAGVATFPNLSLNNPGSGYTLSASDSTTPSITAATSAAFSICTPALFTSLQSLTQGNNAQTNPVGGLVADSSGNLYGVTSGGGLYGYGTTYELSGPGHSICTTLFSFNSSFGSPYNGLTIDPGGNLYGTTENGGTSGYGALFELAANHTSFSVLFSFTGTSGNYPGLDSTTLALDSSGNIYGMASSGSGYASEIFELTSNHSIFSILQSFQGYTPPFSGGLTVDSAGNIYGVTNFGGPYHYGTVFELAANHATFTTLVSFTGGGGSYPGEGPEGTLIFDSSGNLYGTTSGVGYYGDIGYGTIFELAANHTTFINLLSLTGASGSYPGAYADAGLTLDGGGNLYGTTTGVAEYSSNVGNGTVFELAANHTTFSSLITFTGNVGSNSGENPSALLLDSSGNLFGTTRLGGTNDEGYVFTVPAASRTNLSSIFAFSSGSGIAPAGNLLADSNGNLYGVTGGGGSDGDGTIFELSGSGYSTYTTLINFTGTSGNFAGQEPTGLTIDGSGNLFGTTSEGGTSNYGTIFELGANHVTFSSLVSFTGTTGNYLGDYTNGPVAIDSVGNLYGTTETGGASGYGSIFELAANHTTFSTLASFTGSSGNYPGAYPNPVILDTAGNLYGTASNYGVSNDGSVFELAANHTTFSTLISFTGNSGSYLGQYPIGALTIDATGNLYGTTENGGASGDGSVFELAANHTAFSSLVSFTGDSGSDPGWDPCGGIALLNGNLFGTTNGYYTYGGAATNYSSGSVYEVAANRTTFTSLFSFTGTSGTFPGQTPDYGLTADSSGNLYGSTSAGGTYGKGTLFEISTAALASKLAFAPGPINAVYGQTIGSSTGVQVAVENSSGQVVTTSSDSITIALGANPAAGSLAGTLTAAAVNGVATFNNLSVSQIGAGYTLLASDTSESNLTTATSTPFSIGYGSTAVSTGSNLTIPFSSSGHSVYITGTFTSSGTGTCNITDNDLDIINGSLMAVTSEVAQGYNGGNWQGYGITSSTAASSTSHLTAIGAIQNNQSGTPIFGAGNLFDGTTPGASDILVKYTYYGDANLDGRVDGSDYTKIDNGFNSRLTGWLNGDFNYDGKVDGSDYTLIDNAFNTQGASLAAQIAEPVTAAASVRTYAAVAQPTSSSIREKAKLTRLIAGVGTTIDPGPAKHSIKAIFAVTTVPISWPTGDGPSTRSQTSPAAPDDPFRDLLTIENDKKFRSLFSSTAAIASRQ